MNPSRLGQTRLGQDPIDGTVVDAQLPGDGADPPLLHMEVAQDLRFEFLGDGQRRALRFGPLAL